MPRNPGCAARPGANGWHPSGMEIATTDSVARQNGAVADTFVGVTVRWTFREMDGLVSQAAGLGCRVGPRWGRDGDAAGGG
jgi:hypothetical protein